MAGAERAALAGSRAAGAHDVAEQVAASNGLLDVHVQVSTTATTVDVTVDARVPAALPGRWSEVTASAHRMREE